MHTCLGCLAQFASSNSLSSHLTQTQNPVCTEVRHSLELFSGHQVRPDGHHSGSHNGVDHSRTFDDGDFERDEGLGDDLDMDSESLPERHGDLTGDEFGDFLDFGDDGWEAPTTRRDSLPDIEMMNAWDQEVGNLQVDENGDHCIHAAEQQMDANRWQTFVETYPSDKAGCPVSSSFMPDANCCYAEQLECEGDTSRNPYWPFTSQLDWDVADWAKMRGPGSTAVSELLRIDNVSFHIGLLKLVNDKHWLNSACKSSWSLIHELARAEYDH